MKLNLPPFEYKLERSSDGTVRIFDTLRNKFVALTPEEWVRQHFVHYLIDKLHYPKGLMANEVSLTLNKTRKRCDTVVYSHRGAPVAIIEYKAPHIHITQAVFEQAARYNCELGARILIVSNGVQHYCCSYKGSGSQYEFLPQIPPYEGIKA